MSTQPTNDKLPHNSTSQTNEQGDNINVPGSHNTVAGGHVDQRHTFTAQTVNQFFNTVASIDREDIDIAKPTWNGSPFPGLRAFTPADTAMFYGRDAQITALIRKVANRYFTIVQGASGSGKSSLVGGGLIPRLKANSTHRLMDTQGWLLPDWGDTMTQRLTLYCTPAGLWGDPFQALAECLLPLLPKLSKATVKDLPIDLCNQWCGFRD